MSEESNLTRRTLLLLFAGAALSFALPDPVYAKDGDSGGDSDSSGSGSGGSGGGSDNSGGGSSDDDDSDDDSDDGDDDNSGSGSGSGKSGRDDNDHDDARDAVRKGKAISLSKALGILKKSESGRVLEVKLVKRSSGFDYRFKVLAKGGKVKTISMDAATGRIRGFLGL